MNVDHFFAIGQQHLKQGSPCEDYALSGQLRPDLVYGIISDGCSGAFANTDVGARAISFAFERCLKNRVQGADDADVPAAWLDQKFVAALKIAFAQNQISPAREDYFATLGAVVSTPSNASLFFFGDGAYLVKYRDGLHKLAWLDFTGNAPYYLNYTLSSDLDMQWREDFASNLDEAARENWTLFRITATGETEIVEEASRPLTLQQMELGYRLDFRPQEEGIELLAVLSDGVTHVSGMEAPEVARAFTAYKTFAGGFVKRRMIHALADFAKEGCVPRDDVAIACVKYEEA